ncbi:mitochondrial import receptor subunit TOM20 homolog [Lineus longissimus]|uniref:mitochondrial import receptor subunit TOM20 homolog n=1 Tax=Lineus longissimus TaxID=88925 RepID=UPI002B4FA27E
MISKATVGLAAASAGICFIGYCIYFDRKRRSDPLFKQRLREKRKKAKQTEKSSFKVELPDPRDNEAMQRFFLKEIQLGEELLGQGQIEEAIEHLSLAVAVCGQSTQLLAVLEQTLPPQVYTLLHENVPKAVKRIKQLTDLGPMMGGMPGMGGMPSHGGPTVTPLEDDLE